MPTPSSLATNGLVKKTLAEKLWDSHLVRRETTAALNTTGRPWSRCTAKNRVSIGLSMSWIVPVAIPARRSRTYGLMAMTCG